MTLAQLPERRGVSWLLPCVHIDDGPAMRWRIVSDDVSRGPFPTMEYAKERIRGLASLKINGWSPYMEQVVVDPRYPFVAWPNGWTTAQLHELAVYARRFHVTLIPEQQTFSHMHESLKWEALAPLAELPHGYLLAESDPRTYRYLIPLIKSVVAAVKPVPFVHLGADEPIDLGRGRTPRTAQVFADHVTRVAGGARRQRCATDDLGRRDPARSHDSGPDPPHHRDRHVSLRCREDISIVYRHGRERRLRSNGCAGRGELERDLSRSRHLVHERRAVRRRGENRARRARDVHDGLARRRRDAVRSDVAVRRLRGRDGVASQTRRRLDLERDVRARVLRQRRSRLRQRPRRARSDSTAAAHDALRSDRLSFLARSVRPEAPGTAEAGARW